MLDAIVDRGAPIVANRVYSATSQLFRFAVGRGMASGSPCVAVARPTKKEPSRERVLTDKEIAELWKATDLPMSDQVRAALQLILITGQRPGEIAGMAWREIDGDVWTIPAERTKNGKQHSVPLTDPAARDSRATEEFH